MAEKEDREMEAWSRPRSEQPAHRPAPAQPAQTFIAEHTVAEGETLSHLALKYYGSAVKDKWIAIYEANKDTIGDNPNRIRVGMVLKIPQLPAA
ncbi:MAG: hypothetical protein Fur0018_05480 [Anaerolineales bacterium]